MLKSSVGATIVFAIFAIPVAGQSPKDEVADSAALGGDEGSPLASVRDSLRSGGDGPELVVMPAGSFEMGCVSRVDCPDFPPWLPVHTVTIPSSLAVGKYEVKFSEWDACVESGGCRHVPDDRGWGRGNRPVVNVSWRDAQEYLAWLSAESGFEYRLLSESEWEYAARAGTGTAYSWGDEIGRNRANCDGCGSRWDADRTAPVGSFGANPFGLHDMHGNVAEWVEDCWYESYGGAPSDGSASRRGDCFDRVFRGGSWGNDPDLALLSAFRFGYRTGARDFSLGFRVVRTLAAQSRQEEVAELSASGGDEGSPLASVRDSLRFGGYGPELVVIPAGSFEMGCVSGVRCRDNELPVHTVTIPAPLAVGKYEVKFSEWDACVKSGGCLHVPDDEGWGRGNRPVVNVSWEDTQEYVAWLSAETGFEYRLLSESEWEYAARAGTGTVYGWGNEIGRNRANCYRCGSFRDDAKTVLVGSFGANRFGLHDMHGNVSEWVEDCWNRSYVGAPSDGSAWRRGDRCRRVRRGGSYSDYPRSLRSANRAWRSPGALFRYSAGGFRVARTITP